MAIVSVPLGISEEIERPLKLVISDLEQLVSLTEKKYAYIYEVLPDIEREVNLSIREVEILLNHLIFNSQQTDTSDQSLIMDTLGKILAEFEEVAETFLSQELVTVLLRTFLDKSGEDKQNFSELIRVARKVEETLSVLRDLALNSIIFSIRIGEAGAGFQILSDRINQISIDLGSQFGTMKTTINRLNEWNENFQKTLVEFVEYEDQLKSEYRNKFQTEFQQIITKLKTICNILKNNLDNTKEPFANVANIMVMIQSQDIIRQNIENMIKCLIIILERKGCLKEDSTQKCLDYVVFANHVLELSKTLISNIENSLSESIIALGELLIRMDANISDLEEDAHYLAKLFAGNEKETGDCYVLKEVFNAVIGQVVDLMYIKKHIDSKSSSLLESRDTFVELMGVVEKDFAAINKEARGLKKMKVLIKIELARIDLESDYSLDNIINAVDQVIDTINDNQKLFLKLRSYFLKNINEFNTAVNFTRQKIALSEDTIGGSKKKLETTHRLARGAVLASSREMREIFAQLKQPCRHLADTGSIDNLISDARNKIEASYEYLHQFQELMFRQNGITHWEVKVDDLRLLMEQFTCFVERKAMTTVTGCMEQDLGSDGGKLILF